MEFGAAREARETPPPWCPGATATWRTSSRWSSGSPPAATSAAW